ncbi:MAG: mechanosensitive ion channel family protein [Bacteroidales bacterium]|nr:mechanosensitive ion channel family protein [Bacteroidales bacterium]
MEQLIDAGKKFLTDVLFQNIPKLIVALIVLYVGWKLIKLLNRIMKKIYERHQVDASLQEFLHSLIDITLKVLLVLTVMGIIGIQMTSFVAIVGAAGLAVGMALQGTLQNFAGGVIILLLKPFKVGDYIEQGSYSGIVKSIQIFNTTIVTYDNLTIVVPNTELATKSLTNYTALPMRRVSVKVGISYGESVEKARSIALDVINKNPYVSNDYKEPNVYVNALGESSVDLLMLVWATQDNYWQCLFTLNQEIYEAFQKNGIEIPFNQMDIHIKQN